MIEDHGSFLLVEGDIYLPKEQLRAAPKARSGGPRGPRYQYATTNRVSNSKVYQIVVDLSGLNSQTAWQSAARDAISHWSGITDTHVEMSEGSPADITVSTTCTSSNIAAFASFPSGGNPGSTIYVNTCFGYSTTHAQKVHNMVHELGHTIGFRHSNYTQMGESAGTEGANHLYGTPTSGNATGSVMNGGTALNSWAGFASSDVTATQRLYPIPGPYPVSVTNSNGTPLISWTAMSGATSYTVSLVYYDIYDGYGGPDIYQRWVWPTTTTTSTSYLDTANVYTGSHECTYDNWSPGGWKGSYYTYAVQATLPHGTSVLVPQVEAPVAVCVI
ncbi:MAG TPA: M57 family metalloprotease [Longimicrobium sp.]|nr:M57 family metalloprotease [Longimicrobium sp.]